MGRRSRSAVPSDVRIGVQVTPDERRRLQWAGARVGLSAGQWLRGIGLRQLDRLERDQPELADAAPVVDDPVRLTEAAIDRHLAITAPRRLTDREVGDRVGVTPAVVRHHRRTRGIAPVEDLHASHRSGWQARLAELVGRGLSTDEIAAETGWTRRSVQTRISTGRREGWLLPPEPTGPAPGG